MRAMRAKSFNGYEDLELVDLPKPEVKDGRVLVRVTAAGRTRHSPPARAGWIAPRAKAPNWAIAAMESSCRYHIAAPMLADLCQKSARDTCGNCSGSD